MELFSLSLSCTQGRLRVSTKRFHWLFRKCPSFGLAVKGIFKNEAVHGTWQLWMASLKKSSNNRFWREGFLINASLMLPRKTLQINERERIWKGCEQWQGKMGDFLVRLVEKEVTSTWTISFFNRFTSRLHFREREALR